MRIFTIFLCSLFALEALAHENTWTSSDTTQSDPSKVMSDAEMDALDARLARLDSEHLYYAQARIPQADSVATLPMTDSVFKYYMAELDARTPFEMEYNEVVEQYMKRYLRPGSSRMSRMLAHGQYYFPMFEEYLAKYNMPLELKYLAIVESALNPKAKSGAGATGLWQFMYSTGKAYGLNVNSYVDDRNDPLKSTEAACKYMLRLYDLFEDWNLVLAAYNSGPGNVNKAIRQSGGKTSYWEIRPFLPRETSAYVPLFIAATYAFEYAPQYGLVPAEIPVYYIETDTVRITKQIHYKQIEEELGIEPSLLEFLNPQYRYNIVPVVTGQQYYLTLPANTAMTFRMRKDTLYSIATEYFEERKSEVPDLSQMNEKTTHRVKSGETLGHIAGKYGVRVSEIKRWNGLSSDMIRIGQRLVVYPRRI